MGLAQVVLFPFFIHLLGWQFLRFRPSDGKRALKIFKSNGLAALLLAMAFYIWAIPNGKAQSDDGPCTTGELTKIYKPLCSDPRSNIFCPK